MRPLRIIDLVLQGIILLIALIGAVAGESEGRLIWVALAQFPMGIFQLISAIVTSVKGWRRSKDFMAVYWIWVGIYFLGLGFFAVIDKEDVTLAWFFSAWAIALYYFIAGFIIGRREAIDKQIQQSWQQGNWPNPPQPQ